MNKVSVILVKWKREKELDEIIENLKQYPFFDEIAIWDNSQGENIQVFGRWLGAQAECENQIIYTQDDDCIVENIQQLYDNFIEDPTRLSNGLKPEAMESYAKRNHTLVGWGAFFKRHWVDALGRYTRKYGEDHILYTNADRIMTALFPKPYNTIPVTVRDFPTATDPTVAMASQPSYFEDTAEAMRRVETLL